MQLCHLICATFRDGLVQNENGSILSARPFVTVLALINYVMMGAVHKTSLKYHHNILVTISGIGMYGVKRVTYKFFIHD